MAGKLAALEALFGDDNKSAEGGKITVNTEQLIPFANHPFKLYTGKRYDDMVRSVKEFGIIQPLIVRPVVANTVEVHEYQDKINKYEILAGHNRWNCAIEAGLKEVPVIIMEGLSEDEAMLIVTETNLIQRSFTDLLHSERALVLARHHEALKCQGKRKDLIEDVKNLLNMHEINDEGTSGPLDQKLSSREVMGKEYSLSGSSIARYLRINSLSDELKKYIDTEEISIRAGVELSYLSEDNQIYLVDILNNNNYKVDIKVAGELRDLQKQNKLDESVMESVLAGTYNKPKKALSIFKGIKVKPNIIKKYFNEKQSANEVEEIIDKALALYYQNNGGSNNE
ncbi:chromosome partitioning protein ParB [Anaerocolumna cellulosilytica]|uniref:Chromosome partitioning protein ParB n=1 Tax=Anaerocolumna cellulosilytica TaxID=433286 RepID=A0A6S6QV04_9FIRM|nr:ParB N-terminal domain-containing protein [Anaerocolumna cellulosilytica]MBB5194572.1 ParB family chromosome partitioning protein [Anaerocolumna cellulosilytica]BCJ93516.1 chromosome partitioning protein ParB [Anaerocolumna cellulosilytica]